MLSPFRLSKNEGCPTCGCLSCPTSNLSGLLRRLASLEAEHQRILAWLDRTFEKPKEKHESLLHSIQRIFLEKEILKTPELGSILSEEACETHRRMQNREEHIGNLENVIKEYQMSFTESVTESIALEKILKELERANEKLKNMKCQIAEVVSMESEISNSGRSVIDPHWLFGSVSSTISSGLDIDYQELESPLTPIKFPDSFLKRREQLSKPMQIIHPHKHTSKNMIRRKISQTKETKESDVVIDRNDRNRAYYDSLTSSLNSDDANYLRLDDFI